MSVEPIKRHRTATASQGSSTSIRGKLNEQLNKLQVKHHAEVDLLEDMKLFARQRSVLEKQYAEGLHRLVTQFLGKRGDIQPPPPVAGFERHENRGLLEVWKALLEKTEELSKRRLTMCELLTTQVAEVMKQQKRTKETNFKKLIEICQKMNSEVLESVKELSTSKKSYGELEKVCEDARSKFNEADTRLKKRDLKFFESLASLEKVHGKASEKLKSCQKRTTTSRNDYLLAVATCNAHLKRHGSKDLPQIMQALDGEMYEKVRNAYSLFAQIEADTAKFVSAEFEDLAEQAYLVNREYVLECFLYRNPVLAEVQSVKFEPQGQDTATAICRDHGSEIFLDKDARKWANKLTKDQMTIASLQKQIKGLKTVTSAYTKNPEFGTSDAQTEALQNIDTLLEEIRQLEVQTTKAEARLDCLRSAGIDVNKWLQKAEKSHEKTTSNELTPNMAHGRVSQLSLPSSMGGSSQELDAETWSMNSGQLGHDDNGSMESDTHVIKYCRALYNYTAQREDELNITEHEELEVLEWDDGDGWCKGRSRSSGLEGYFPQSYVQPISRPPSPSAATTTTTTSSMSNELFSPNSSATSVSTIATSTSIPLAVSTPTTTPTPLTGAKTLLRAVYEYTAQFSEELSFPEGATIELLRTDENGIDDGWWEGLYNGKVGVFPSLVVEIIKSDSTSPDVNATLLASPLHHPPPPMESPPPLPPDYSPPPLSPEVNGVGPGAQMVPEYNSTPNTFSIGGINKISGRLQLDSFDEYDSD